MSLDCRHRLRIEGKTYCASVAVALPNRKLGDLKLCEVCPQRDKPGPDVGLEYLYDIAKVHIGEPARQPSLVHKVSKYLMALARWAHAGCPERTPQQVQEVLETCRGCRHFQGTDDGKHMCHQCGCGGIASKWTGGLLEKITMGTERCPLGKW